MSTDLPKPVVSSEEEGVTGIGEGPEVGDVAAGRSRLTSISIRRPLHSNQSNPPRPFPLHGIHTYIDDIVGVGVVLVLVAVVAVVTIVLHQSPTRRCLTLPVMTCRATDAACTQHSP